MALVLAKFLLVDRMRLKSFNMLASVVLVGLASVVVDPSLADATSGMG
jgi:hypothetical protein